MADWQTQSSEVVYETPWIRVRRDEVTNHNGTPLTYSVVDIHHPAVFIVAMNPAGEVLLQRQYRYPINQAVWEVPAGHSENDNALDEAKRELLEETGLVSDEWSELGKYYSAVGVANLPAVAFLARNVRHESNKRDVDEDIIEQRFIPADEVLGMITNGEILVSTAISALYAALLPARMVVK